MKQQEEIKELKWWQKTCIYQIYPRSYMDSNGDGIGDIQGIISRLDYIHETGFETIWISPFYKSPQQDFGYDISDYFDIAPEYGTLADVDQLISEVHKRGMYIVFDMVMNHTSVEHPWFKESRSSRDNPKRNWYIWRDGKGKKRPPNNWKAMIGGSGWQYDKLTRQWFWASFLPFQPDLNYHNPDVKNTMLNMVRFWLNKGVDGFRLDIFNAIFKDESFRNNPFSMRPLPSESNSNGFFQNFKYTVNHLMDFEFAKELRSVIDEFSNPDRFLIGEVFGADDVIKQYLGEKQDGLNLIFLFEMLRFKFNADYFRKQLVKYENYYPYPYIPTFVFSNHDRVRSIYNVDNDVNKARLLAVFQFMARGVPANYMGEEIGMQESRIRLKDALDPLALKYRKIPQWLVDMVGPYLNRDGCRTPMQWDSTIHAGFSASSKGTWLPVHPCFKEVNVAGELADTNSLLNTFKKLLTLRKSLPSVQNGTLKVVNTGNNKLLSFTRSFKDEKVMVIINFSEKNFIIDHPDPLLANQVFECGKASVSGKKLSLPAISALIIKN